VRALNNTADEPFGYSILPVGADGAKRQILLFLSARILDDFGGVYTIVGPDILDMDAKMSRIFLEFKLRFQQFLRFLCLMHSHIDELRKMINPKGYIFVTTRGWETMGCHHPAWAACFHAIRADPVARGRVVHGDMANISLMRALMSLSKLARRTYRIWF
jgi:hypothetical protein